MENEHIEASSFIYNDNLFVVGGKRCKSMEALNIKQFPLTWRKVPTELPYECRGHQTVVYKEQIFLIGGYIDGKKSDLISEIKITGAKSHVLKELCHMPEPLKGHRAVVVDDKILIFGGDEKYTLLLSSVLEFDPRTLTFREMPPLPPKLIGMATVQWKDQVVLLGGWDRRKRLNSVIMYDIKTGKITVLPSMLEERYGCCAVITGDTIVVMGGKNDKWEDLKSVECFEMGSSSSWTYLPSMNESRVAAIAEVLPFGQKYV
ncbi:kelch-like protein 12 [Xenia sp. Carnegie-2017]|uniref:kelch-like protein 12 n=1 Tax=Xenia sp. Carnegie-2017 TaxID=2897299 RepID=UPI001F045577|nr:kelch-like protein 12 [Xenia sp. Carnegie-2017]